MIERIKEHYAAIFIILSMLFFIAYGVYDEIKNSHRLDAEQKRMLVFMKENVSTVCLNGFIYYTTDEGGLTPAYRTDHKIHRCGEYDD